MLSDQLLVSKDSHVSTKHLAAVLRNERARVSRLEGVDKEAQCHEARWCRDLVLHQQTILDHGGEKHESHFGPRLQLSPSFSVDRAADRQQRDNRETR